MKPFLLKILIFFLPLLLALFPPLYVLYKTGEGFTPIDDYIAQNKNFLIGYAYHDSNYEYLKWKTLTSKPPFEVWALGSSRVLSFRQQMFDVRFYNAGFTITSVSDFVPFLEGIPKHKYPKYILLGLDQWMFNENREKNHKKLNRNHWQKSFKAIPNLLIIKYIWQDLLQKKYTINIVPKQNDQQHVGLNAIVNNIGFRNDGSIYYGQEIKKLLANDSTANDFDFKETYGRIEKGNRKFEYGQHIKSEALQELTSTLQFCHKNNIKVIGFLPPFADGVLRKMKYTGKYQYMEQLPEVAAKIFRENNAVFYNFTTLKSCNSNDSEVIDGFHGSETTYMKMLLKMLENDSLLNKICNKNRLQNDVKKPLNRLEIYE